MEMFERHQRDNERMTQEFIQRRREVDQESAPSIAKCLFWAFLINFIGRLLILGLAAFVTDDLPACLVWFQTIIPPVISFFWTNVSLLLCFVGGMIAGYGAGRVASASDQYDWGRSSGPSVS